MLWLGHRQVVAQAQRAVLAPPPDKQTAIDQQGCAVPITARNLHAAAVSEVLFYCSRQHYTWICLNEQVASAGQAVCSLLA